MDVLRAWRSRVVGRFLVLILPLLVLLVVSVIWNVWQYRLIDHERQRVLATEQEKARQDATEAAHIQARRVKEVENAASNQRVQQLYREIDNLGQVSDRLLAEPVQQPESQSLPDSHEAADGPP
jgi:cell division protein FtsX